MFIRISGCIATLLNDYEIIYALLGFIIWANKGYTYIEIYTKTYKSNTQKMLEKYHYQKIIFYLKRSSGKFLSDTRLECTSFHYSLGKCQKHVLLGFCFCNYCQEFRIEIAMISSSKYMINESKNDDSFQISLFFEYIHIISLLQCCHELIGCIFCVFQFSLFLKGTLIQIWKSANIFVFIRKWYVKDFTLKHLLLFEICAREIRENVLYKH